MSKPKNDEDLEQEISNIFYSEVIPKLEQLQTDNPLALDAVVNLYIERLEKVKRECKQAIQRRDAVQLEAQRQQMKIRSLKK